MTSYRVFLSFPIEAVDDVIAYKQATLMAKLVRGRLELVGRGPDPLRRATYLEPALRRQLAARLKGKPCLTLGGARCSISVANENKCRGIGSF